MKVLGIESSCDETAAAIVDESGRVIGDVVASQMREHAPYGGVVPELASRAHIRAIGPVIRGALAQADATWDDLSAIAVTAGPGLVGSLLVGVQTARAVAMARKLPLVGVDHLLGHLVAISLRYPPDVAVPTAHPDPSSEGYVALLASGGHTGLYHVPPRATLFSGARESLLENIRCLGETRDDAAGEAFDKAAKLLGLAYPGGPVIDRLAKQGDPTRVALPRPMLTRDSLEFSFSGLKTALLHHVKKYGVPSEPQALADLCASYQAAIVEVLAEKTVEAARRVGTRNIVLSGGVAANRGLRDYAAHVAQRSGLVLHIPPTRACTDNAAMIALAGVLTLLAGLPAQVARVYSRSQLHVA